MAAGEEKIENREDDPGSVTQYSSLGSRKHSSQNILQEHVN